jgi:hypothetical protein
MASDVILLVVDDLSGAVVAARWIGMSDTIQLAREVLDRDPDHRERGFETWAVSADEVALIATGRYAGGLDEAEPAALVERLEGALHSSAYLWILEHDF